MEWPERKGEEGKGNKVLAKENVMYIHIHDKHPLRPRHTGPMDHALRSTCPCRKSKRPVGVGVGACRVAGLQRAGSKRSALVAEGWWKEAKERGWLGTPTEGPTDCPNPRVIYCVSPP